MSFFDRIKNEQKKYVFTEQNVEEDNAKANELVNQKIDSITEIIVSGIKEEILRTARNTPPTNPFCFNGFVPGIGTNHYFLFNVSEDLGYDKISISLKNEACIIFEKAKDKLAKDGITLHSFSCSYSKFGNRVRIYKYYDLPVKITWKKHGEVFNVKIKAKNCSDRIAGLDRHPHFLSYGTHCSISVK